MIKKTLGKINLLEGNILKNLLLLSAPLMATSFVGMAYTLTDTIWVGKLGADAVAAAGTANFFTWMAGAIASITRVGTTVYAAQEYGSNRKDKLYNTLKNGIILQVFIMILITLLVSLVKKIIVGFYDLESDVFDMAVSYLQIFSFGFIFTSLGMLFSSIYNALGNSFFPFVANVIGMLLNIVIDPIMIFGFGPIPPMGIAGAAYASIFSQFIVFIIMILNIFITKNELYQSFLEGKLSINNMYEKFKKGFPIGIMSLAHASISLLLGKYMSLYGTEAMAAFSVGSNIESLTWMTTEGLQGGITSFVGQNYGAKLFDRLREVIKKSVKIVFIIGTATTFIITIFRYQLFSLFISNDQKTLEYGVNYLLIIGAAQLPMSIELGVAGILNGLGDTKIPAAVSIIFNATRIPISLFLMNYIGVYGVWASMTITCILKGLFAYIMLNVRIKKLNFE